MNNHLIYNQKNEHVEKISFKEVKIVRGKKDEDLGEKIRKYKRLSFLEHLYDDFLESNFHTNPKRYYNQDRY